ncbi:protein LURP-one-related 10-like [Bidens hawaiensis]|uniref:protein LURP-one-related 10-like n=1 Tax=Bidens hawaiensis TaxID=980011 RepID=UPI00404A901E
MMAQPGDHAAESSFSVIGPQFIAPHSRELIIEKYLGGSLVITDTNHTILLKVRPCDTIFHRQRLLVDAKDAPIVMLREKMMSVHKQWVAFRGESIADSDMIFRTKKEHMIQFKTHVISVLLADNDDCGLKIEGSWKKRNYTIGDSSTPILAQMHEPQTLRKMKSGEDKFMVTIQPNMDYAFVVALFAIVNAMEIDIDKKQCSKIAIRLGFKRLKP